MHHGRMYKKQIKGLGPVLSNDEESCMRKMTITAQCLCLGELAWGRWCLSELALGRRSPSKLPLLVSISWKTVTLM